MQGPVRRRARGRRLMARVFISHSSRDGDAADRIKDWLLGQGFETPFLDFDKHAGIPPGAQWEQVLYREIDACDAVVIVQTPNWLESKWCFAEFTQARALGKPIFPVIHAPTGDTLISPDIQALDLTRDVEGGLEQLARALTGIALDAQSGFDWDRARPPFPGLLAFQAEDAAIYFGRDDDIRRLIERLDARRVQGGARIVALLGASGSGKSSLVRAGVLPRLARAGRRWIAVPPMRPQSRPLDELARALAVATDRGSAWRALRDALQGADRAGVLRDLVADLRMRHAANEAQILLTVDQAEELFGAADPAQAEAFMAVLNAIDALPDAPLTVLFAMRSDYLGALQAAPGLVARFEEFSLGPLPLARYPQIIEGPARVAGLAVDAELVQRAAADAQTEDALPLLAFALRELYDRAAGDGRLSLDEYLALGDAALGLTPLENAVRRAADAVLSETRPAPEALAALETAFIPALVRINDAGEYVRQPALWDDLPARAHPLLERLAQARLLVVRQEEEGRIVEVAHEALLRKWPRLRGWLDEAREFLAGRQQLQADRADWERAGEADKARALLTGLKLTRARGWLAARPTQLSAADRAFVQASIDREDAEAARTARNRKRLLAASVAASVIFAGLGAVSMVQRAAAVEARAAAEAAQEETERAFRERATDMLGFAWADLGGQANERARLTRAAVENGIHPDEIVPKIIVHDPETFQPLPQPDGFDCGTGLENGFRFLYCSIRDVINLGKMQSIAGLPVFEEGSPHGEEFDLAHPTEFGRYNEDFLDWLDAYIIPATREDGRVNALTRVAYDAYVSDIARALYHTHRILFATAEEYCVFEANYAELQALAIAYHGERAFGIGYMGYDLMSFEEISADYKALLARQEPLPDFYFENRFFPVSDYLTNVAGDDWYLANTAGGFWVRRTIDGTEDQIYDLVVKLLTAFEPEALDFDPTDPPVWRH